MNDTLYRGVQPYFPPEDREKILAGIGEILTSGQLTQGRWVEAFEAAGAAMAGTKYAVAVNSGGTALELALQALDVEGGEVLVPTNTFVASASSVVRAGGKPIFVDVDSIDLSVSLASAASRLTTRTRGLMLVHLFGQISPRLPEILEFCRRYNLFLIEDAAHAHGASFQGKPAGSFGNAACFSYYSTKLLTTGEGGLVTTDDAELAARIRSSRDHGRGPSGQDFAAISNNFRLAEIPALLGVVQHGRLEEILEHRRQVAGVFREVLELNNAITLVDPEPREGHAYWRYAVLIDKDSDRTQLQRVMADRYHTRITWMYEPLCHQQPAFAGNDWPDQDFPVAVGTLSRLVNLPTHMGVPALAARRIAEGMRELLPVRAIA